ncbi:hypothetical protein CU098_011895 [Rhizopus stolonifer]|uniref:Uncharacterized protein n=1 Tax=Rhizopus stolonifer TaxID=4846 RepID=A0A367KJC9_RHIST|nr:hypothetical protein CU098_011895 [Rhizopus stolonifer]
MRLSTDILCRCSDDLENEYQTHVKNMRSNSSLVTTIGEGCTKLLKKLYAVDMDNFSQEIFNTNYTCNNTFVKFLKQSYNDLCICWNDPQPYNQYGERTLFSEIFLQQFKLFSKMTKLLYFKWIEKKLQNTDHIWLTKKNYVKKDVQLKLLDGVGIMKKNNVNFIMLESSGVEDDIFTHTLEDTIKNLKHGTDSLSSILCDYKDCNVETAQKLVVLTGHIIKDKLTIMKYSPGNTSKWVAVEVRSCAIPLVYENRKATIKLYETFAYIYLTLKEQEEIYDKLTDEKLGFTIVEEKDMVKNCNVN